MDKESSTQIDDNSIKNNSIEHQVQTNNSAVVADASQDYVMHNQPGTSQENDHVMTLTSEENITEQDVNNDNNLLVEHYSLSTNINKPLKQQEGNEHEMDSFKKPTSSNMNVQIIAEDNGPKLYPVKGNIVTPPIIVKNLPEAFSSLPVHGRPKSKEVMDEFQTAKLKEFVGCNLNHEEFEELAEYCSVDHLKTFKELTMTTNYPCPLESGFSTSSTEDGEHLCTIKKYNLRMDKDTRYQYQKKLKYRGLRLCSLAQAAEDPMVTIGQPLQPGKDMLFRVRVYRPFTYNRDRQKRTRHSVFSRDIVLLGRHKLTELRDRIVCANDVGMRIDVSDRPDDQSLTSAKDVFPSGFLFINNVFYVDTREGCSDISAPVRAWAANRGIGQFPHRDMCDVKLEDMVIKLGHPEVYVHQGNCEHLFTFSEIRLLNHGDPLTISHYPCHTAISNNQSLYCTTCAEFGAKWIVVGCSRLPFDPAFSCDTCLKLYLYKDGQKIGDFKAYAYKGNELSVLKPV